MDLAAVPKCKQHEGQLKGKANQGLSACDAQRKLWCLFHAQVDIGREDHHEKKEGSPSRNQSRAWKPQKDAHKHFPGTCDINQF